MQSPLPRRRSWRKIIMLTLIALFLVPVAARAALFAFEDRPSGWRNADWSSIGALPAAAAHPRLPITDSTRRRQVSKRIRRIWQGRRRRGTGRTA